VPCHDAPPCRWLDSLGNGRLGRAKRARQGRWPAPPRSTRRRSPTGLLVALSAPNARGPHRVLHTRCSSVACTDEHALAVPDKIISHCPFAFGCQRRVMSSRALALCIPGQQRQSELFRVSLLHSPTTTIYHPVFAPLPPFTLQEHDLGKWARRARMVWAHVGPHAPILRAILVPRFSFSHRKEQNACTSVLAHTHAKTYQSVSSSVLLSRGSHTLALPLSTHLQGEGSLEARG
jgi:hypothetical protein